MDNFEKLAKLVGATAAPTGEGLPRTKEEAEALGLTKYFTGEPCKNGHIAIRYLPSKTCRACIVRSNETPEKREYQRQYESTPEFKNHRRQINRAKTGDDILFAIGQAEYAATKSRTPADIIPQCPEPQRSQLQALVDRIKADPQAGKAVVGLLRSMRELRKAELAEMKSGVDAEAASG